LAVWKEFVILNCNRSRNLLTQKIFKTPRRAVGRQRITRAVSTSTNLRGIFFVLMAKIIKEVSVIEFEGKKCGNGGYYLCPFNCHRADYPRPKWKSEKGFRTHMASCPKRPSLLKLKEENNELEQGHYLHLQKEVLNAIPYDIGQKIAYVVRIVVKPEYEQRGNRQVRVRYEPVLRFEAFEAEIRSISFRESKHFPSVQYVRDNLLYFNTGISIRDICCDFQTAKELAERKTKEDEEYRHRSSMIR